MIETKWCGYCKTEYTESDNCRCIVEGVVYPTSIWYHEPCGYCHDDPCYCDGFGNWISMETYHWRKIKAFVRDENVRIAYRNAIKKLH